MPLINSTTTRFARDSRPGRPPWRRCCERAGGRAVGGRGEEDRRRGALRRILAVALPPVGEKEPAALDIRGSASAGLQRGPGWGRPLDHADPVPDVGG